MNALSNTDIRSAVNPKPKRHSTIVVTDRTDDARMVFFTTTIQIAEHLSTFGPVFMVGPQGKGPAYGYIRNWRLNTDFRYNAGEVLSYIDELGEALDELKLDEGEKRAL